MIRGVESMDNAGVYRLRDDLAIIQTVDFFTPVVDDPYTFGAIAAANALSDVYTMGGKPLTAMNLVCFPSNSMDISVLGDILRGGLDKMTEANVVLVGGHSIDDTELKYGLSVTGVIHPDKLITNGGACSGDKLILTKPLGTGIISTALKAGVVSKKTTANITRSMLALNARSSELMQEVGVHACTDITGFGFIGHVVQMAQNSKVGIKVDIDSIPIFPETVELAKRGFLPGGLKRNWEFYSACVKIGNDVPEHVQEILFDPQTSGGLLISLAGVKAKRLLLSLKKAGIEEAAIVGEVVSKPKGIVIVSSALLKKK